VVQKEIFEFQFTVYDIFRDSLIQTRVYNMAILHKQLHKLEITLKYVKKSIRRTKKYTLILRMNILYSDRRHVSATQGVIFRVVSARIRIYL